MEYCPNCIEEMHMITKRYGPEGGKRILYKCQSCGYSELKNRSYYDNMEMTAFMKTKKRTNRNEGLDESNNT